MIEYLLVKNTKKYNENRKNAKKIAKIGFSLFKMGVEIII